MTTKRRSIRTSAAVATGAALALCAGASGLAQSASSTLSSFSKGAGALESPVNVSTRDSNGNLEIVNGVMQAPQGSIFSNLSTAGVSGSTSGAGAAGSAVAIGNNLQVSVSGNYNTVIVNATQTNSGAITASTVLNGKVNLDGAQ